MKYSAIKSFPIIIITVVLSNLLLAQEQSPPSPAEALLKKADLLFVGNELPQALESYQSLLQSADLPAECRPLVMMRLARAQLAAQQPGKCRETIRQMNALDYLPEHYRLETAELLAVLDGKPDTAAARAPKPQPGDIAAMLAVHSGADKTKADGTIAHPFATLPDALLRARQLRQQSDLPAGAIQIVLKDASYSPATPILLEAADSGTERNPLLIDTPNPQTKVVFDGSITLKLWKPQTDAAILARLPEAARGKVLVASLAENGVPPITDFTLGGFSSSRRNRSIPGTETLLIPELFYQGKAQTLARWPNDGDLAQPLDKFTDERPLRWVDETNLWLHGYWCYQWADAYEKVQSISPADRKINLEPPVNNYGFKDSVWHAVNALSEIDQTGEYHLDTVHQQIHFLPPDNFDPSQCRISVYGPVIVANQCSYLFIRNLDLRFIRGDGMIFNQCENLTLTGCSVRGASGYGLLVNGGLHHRLHSISIDHMGRGGMIVNSGDWQKLITSGTSIENCRISDLSRIDRTYTPALAAGGMGFRIRHNSFSQIPSSALRTECSESLVELNDFANCVSESDDQGVIDVWGNPFYRGNIIRWNCFHDIKGRHGMVAGIRLDDAISGFMITQNIFLRTGGGRFGGVQIHGGKDSFVDRNLFIDCPTVFSNSGWGQERWLRELKNHEAISRNVNTTPWQTPQWQSRYPALKHLLDPPADRNFIVDNLAVNCDQLYKGMSRDSLAFANQQTTQPPSDWNGAQMQKLLLPWHTLKPELIGAAD